MMQKIRIVSEGERSPLIALFAGHGIERLIPATDEEFERTMAKVEAGEQVVIDHEDELYFARPRSIEEARERQILCCFSTELFLAMN